MFFLQNNPSKMFSIVKGVQRLALTKAVAPCAAPIFRPATRTAAAPTGVPLFFRLFSDTADPEIKTGTCKWFDSRKGFGFIVADDGSGDVFVHQTRIHKDGFRSLAEGEALEFRVVEERGKTQATDVTGPEGAYVQGAPPPAMDGYDSTW